LDHKETLAHKALKENRALQVLLAHREWKVLKVLKEQ
jgi:hypothetical protein